MHAAAAHAKVNLHLAVLAREESGYHQIETVFCALQLADDVEVTTAGRGIQLDVAGPDLGPIDENLAHRAAVAFFEQTRVTPAARIRLVKRIPAGAGLGGGSSNAAATLAALNALHGYPLGAPTLREIGFSIGSDVPFFVAGVPLALAWGRGERLLSIPPPPETPVLLVVPPEPVATRDAYEALDARRRTRLEHAPSRVLALDDLRTFESIAAAAVNDFEDIVFDRHPDLRRIKQLLAASGALHALLTGTGSALFGLFPTSAALDQASERVRAEFPSVNVVRTTTCARL
jgi:4-diphosphocytidyl-2-C-methyl-D-erythritol kinase